MVMLVMLVLVVMMAKPETKSNEALAGMNRIDKIEYFVE
jgi:hypothetical protein